MRLEARCIQIQRLHRDRDSNRNKIPGGISNGVDLSFGSIERGSEGMWEVAGFGLRQRGGFGLLSAKLRGIKERV